jgi:hypothetical protein
VGTRGPLKFLPELASGRGTSRRSRMVEGQPRNRLRQGSADDRIDITKHFRRGNPEGLNTGSEKPGIPRFITSRPVASGVRFPIYFHREARIAAEEIEDERAGRVLASKFQPARPVTQRSPKKGFGQAHLGAERARSLHGSRRSFRCNVLEHSRPSTMLRMVPHPETSSGRIWCLP